MSNLVMLPMLVKTVGLCLVVLGLWELRVGMDRKKYALYMFIGLFLIFILPSLLLGVGLILK